MVFGCLKSQDREDSDGGMEGGHAVDQADGDRVLLTVIPGQIEVRTGAVVRPLRKAREGLASALPAGHCPLCSWGSQDCPCLRGPRG